MSALRPPPVVAVVLFAAGLLCALAVGAGGASAATITVRSGDTLGAIAARHGTSVAALARTNGIDDPDVVRAGARLRLPGPGAVARAGGTGPSRRTYTVRPGDTLGAVAARHGTSVAALARANAIRDPDVLRVGRRLVIGGAAPSAGPAPGRGGYTVRPGDTLEAIAVRHGTTVAALAALNGIADPDVLAVGRRLSVPGARPTAPVAATTRPGYVASLLHLYADRHGVERALVRAVAWQESRWLQSARSSAGAIGVMQLMPATARWFGPAVLGRRIDPTRIEDNIEGGVAYLAWLRRQTAGDTRTAIGAYYQGLAAMRARGPYDDTRDYVASVLSFRGRV